MKPGTVLHKRNVRRSKYDSLVEPVQLIEANPSYALVRFDNGAEDTVSLRDLAPAGELVDHDDLMPPYDDSNSTDKDENMDSENPAPGADTTNIADQDTFVNRQHETKQYSSPSSPVLS